MYYMVGGVLFCVSILMALTPTWAPLEVAFFMSANMFSQAIYLRSLTKQPLGEPSKLTSRVADSTVKTES